MEECLKIEPKVETVCNYSVEGSSISFSGMLIIAINELD